MKAKKSSKKAVTMLTRIDRLLSDVLDECSAIEKNVEKNVRVLLLSAKESIVSAKDFVSASLSSEVRHKASPSKAKPPARAKKRAQKT